MGSLIVGCSVSKFLVLCINISIFKKPSATEKLDHPAMTQYALKVGASESNKDMEVFFPL